MSGLPTIITFLGTNPRKARYKFLDGEYEGEQFALALRQFCQFDRMLVCATEDAEKLTWPLIEKVRNDSQDERLELVRIPTGRNADETWQLFTEITSRINDGEHVVFDITNGLRSLPFLVFLFAAYLRIAKRVEIDAVYYGAFELRGNSEITPVLDLTEFVRMIDWITATDQFVTLGDGASLSRLVQTDDPTLADAIRNMSLALSLSRPLHAMAQAASLETALSEHKGTKPSGRPFELLSERVQSSYASLALSSPREDASLRRNLQIQSDMVRWYLDKHQYVHAVTLARELIVSLVGVQLKISAAKLFDENRRREVIEKAINQVAIEEKGKEFGGESSKRLEDFRRLSNAKAIAKVYSELGEVRNDIAHSEMRLRPIAATDLVNSSNRLCNEVRELVVRYMADPNP